MKKLIITLVAVATLGAGMISCGKYEEGPGISLRTKNSRATGSWQIDKYVDSNGNETQPGTTLVTTYKLKDEGVYEETNSLGTITGTWTFDDAKENIIIVKDLGILGTSTSSNKIIKLEYESIGFEDSDGDKIYYKRIEE